MRVEEDCASAGSCWMQVVRDVLTPGMPMTSCCLRSRWKRLPTWLDSLRIRKIGLGLNTSKTKVITNEMVSYEYVDIVGSMVEVLGPNSEHKFLGRYLSGNLDNRVHTEVQHRIKVGWMKFGQYSKTLCNKNISIKLRMKLFDSVVSPSLFFGLAILPLHVSSIEKINIVQRKMLRKIVGWVRIQGETWENTMRRMSTRVDSAVDSTVESIMLH